MSLCCWRGRLPPGSLRRWHLHLIARPVRVAGAALRRQHHQILNRRMQTHQMQMQLPLQRLPPKTATRRSRHQAHSAD